MKLFLQQNRSKLFFIFILLGLLATSILIVQDFGASGSGCVGFSGGEESVFNCEDVTSKDPLKNSGLSSSVAGFGFFALLMVFYLMRTFGANEEDRAGLGMMVMIYMGLVYSLVLTLYQTFLIEGTCLYCLLTFFDVVALAGLLQIEEKPGVVKQPDWLFMGGSVVIILVLPYLFNSQLQTGLINTFTPAQCEYVSDYGSMAPQTYREAVSTGFSKGNPDAEVVVMEFFDPLCPHCQNFYPEMQQLATTYGDRVRFVYKPFKLGGTPHQFIGALFAAAEEDQFFEMLDLMFADPARPGRLSGADIERYLKKVGLGDKEVIRNLNNNAYAEQIEQFREHGRKLGLQGVPAVYVNGKMLKNFNTLEECLQAQF